MAMNRKIREAIVNDIRERKAVTVDEVTEIVKTYEEMPDIRKLVYRHYKEKARRILSSIRDEDGERDFFAVEDDAGERFYVNVPITNNLVHLDKVQQQLNTKQLGIVKSRVKVKKRQKEVAEQLAFDFEQEEEQKESDKKGA